MKQNGKIIPGLKRVLANARRLHDDAELLAKDGRFGSAYVLSLLSVEEIGKVLIGLWDEEAHWQQRAPPAVKSSRLNFHVRKQIAFATLIFAGEVIDARRERPDAEMTTDQFRLLYQDIFDREAGSAILIQAMFGMLNRDKEQILYSDLRNHLAEVVDASEVDARKLLDHHWTAIGRLRDYNVMAFARPAYHHVLDVMAGAYKDLDRVFKASPPMRDAT